MSLQADLNQLPRANKSHADCIDLAPKILGLLDVLDPEVIDLPADDASKYWQHLVRLYHDTFLHAADVLCLQVHRYERSIPSSKHSKANILSSLNRLISNLQEYGHDPEVHLKELLRLALVIQYVQSNSSLDRKEELIRQALDRVVETCSKRAQESVQSSLNGSSHAQDNADTTSSNDFFDWDLFGFDMD